MYCEVLFGFVNTFLSIKFASAESISHFLSNMMIASPLTTAFETMFNYFSPDGWSNIYSDLILNKFTNQS